MLSLSFEVHSSPSEEPDEDGHSYPHAWVSAVIEGVSIGNNAVPMNYSI